MSSLSERPILIAGGGPVGVITALALARQGLPVHAFEAESKVNDAPRAATTHAATLEMLEELGLVEDVIRRGLVEPLFRIWDRSTGKLVAEFDFGKLKNDTRYPFAVQCEQHKLTNLAIERLRAFPHATLEFSARVMSISQSSDTVEIVVATAAGTRTVKGPSTLAPGILVAPAIISPIPKIGAPFSRSRAMMAPGCGGYCHPPALTKRKPNCLTAKRSNGASRGSFRKRAATTSFIATSIMSIKGWRRAFVKAGCFLPAMPPTSIIRWVALASTLVSTMQSN